MTVLANELAGIGRPCPLCGAKPGEPCISARDDAPRRTTHLERKDLPA